MTDDRPAATPMPSAGVRRPEAAPQLPRPPSPPPARTDYRLNPAPFPVRHPLIFSLGGAIIVVGGAVLFAKAIYGRDVAEQGAAAAPAPAAPRLRRITANDEIDVWEDTTTGAVCYVGHSGINVTAVSCVAASPMPSASALR
jgi:hypothetical protein